MSETPDPVTSTATIVTTKPPASDWSLQELAQLANLGVELGITLNIGGLLISGRLSSGQRFFEAAARRISETPFDVLDERRRVVGQDSEGSEILAAAFRKRAQAIYGPGGLRDQQPETLPEFIHLADVYFYTPGVKGATPVNQPVAFWRGKISAIDGFFMGSLD